MKLRILTRWRPKALGVVALLLAWPCLAADGAFILACPERITTQQTLYQPIEGWRASPEQAADSAGSGASAYSEHNLDNVAFSMGVPDAAVILAPDQQTQVIKGQWTSTWHLQASQGVWFSCRYRGTRVVLSKSLPAGLQRCSVRYNRNRGIEVQHVSCQ